ncbi:MAG: hypothetical protein NUW37_16020 [Planctomycetes bacterium]|nr:hypothetical protein [Planctomycetota bacterium]
MTHPIEKLEEIIRRLRHPENGCPWDLKQNTASFTKYVKEEAQELLDAAEKGDFENMREELGDVLWNVIFLAHLCEHEGKFNLEKVIDGAYEKIVRRHPHIFTDEARDLGFEVPEVKSAEDVAELWQKIKDSEKRGQVDK